MYAHSNGLEYTRPHCYFLISSDLLRICGGSLSAAAILDQFGYQTVGASCRAEMQFIPPAEFLLKHTLESLHA